MDVICIVVSNPSLSMTEFLSGIASSGWLKHIRSVMETSIFIAKVGWLVCRLVG